ncbi:DUF6220 domain-containing protein [Gulosibacter molinativorax]|uniref:DUF4293 family protein n=1 Tax=Gulosibacter molinativorax TaxID=256821 RepID=A0ABT7C758_9MICO|nr:DUF6220 domain-containing protein [Gulosibacter molinativorax]MDJ1370501.1 hypothetical protein [Gulosibacter molinativorax]QUY62088.1 Hypothetical protein GMOLON4_1383 [Gulosibacter molinativorax]
MRKVFFVLSILVLIGVGLQYYMAGVGFFSEGQQGFALHGTVGRIVLPVLFILLIIAAAVSRAGKSTIWLTVLMLVLLIMQTLIFILTGAIFGVDENSTSAPVAAYFTVGLHALNPMFILWVGTVVMLRARKLAFGAPAKKEAVGAAAA